MKTKSTTRETQQPTYYAYHVIETSNNEQSNRWHRVGAVFARSNDEGGTLMLDSLPINFDGRLILRAPKLDDAE